MAHFRIPIRLLIAFLCGWLFAFLDIPGHAANVLLPYFQAWNFYPGALAELLFLLLPFGLGIAAAFTVNRRNAYFVLLTLLTGLLALTGFYAYFLPGTITADAQPCDISCQHGPIGRNTTSLLFVIWTIDAVLVIVGSLLTCLILYLILKYRRKRLAAREQHTHQEVPPAIEPE